MALERFVPYLYLLARKHFPQELRGRIDPADVVQETLADAHQALDTLRDTATPVLCAWLRKILSNRLLNLERFHRQNKRDVRRERDLEAQLEGSSCALGHFLAAEQSTPSQQAQRHERALLISQAIHDLPEHQREVVIQRYWEQATLQEIAARLAQTESAVNKLLKAALKTLRPRLQELQP